MKETIEELKKKIDELTLKYNELKKELDEIKEGPATGVYLEGSPEYVKDYIKKTGKEGE